MAELAWVAPRILRADGKRRRSFADAARQGGWTVFTTEDLKDDVQRLIALFAGGERGTMIGAIEGLPAGILERFRSLTRRRCESFFEKFQLHPELDGISYEPIQSARDKNFLTRWRIDQGVPRCHRQAGIERLCIDVGGTTTMRPIDGPSGSVWKSIPPLAAVQVTRRHGRWSKSNAPAAAPLTCGGGYFAGVIG